MILASKLIGEAYIDFTASEGDLGDRILKTLSNANAGKLIERSRILLVA